MIREKGLMVVLVLFFLLANGVHGTLDDAARYAQQYEDGSLDYVKFKVHLQVLEEEFREQLEEQRQEFTLEEERKESKDNQGRELERLGNQAEEALRAKDKEKLVQIIDQIDAEFARLGNNQSALFKAIRTAAEEGNFGEVERLADDIPEDEFRRDGDQREDHFQTEGWSLETVKNIFGEPTGLSNNLWLSNEQRSVIVDEEIPQFEKKVFDGEKVKVTLHAWPNGLQQNGKTIVFYHIGLESVFKLQSDALPETMIQDIVAKVKQYQEGTISLEELAKDAVQRERMMYEFLRENQEQCKTFLGGLLPDRKEVTVKEFRGFLVDSKEFSAEAVIQHQQGDDEHYSIWFDLRSKQEQNQNGGFESKPFTDDLSQKNGEELWTFFEHGFESVAERVDKNDLARTQAILSSKQDELNRYLNEIQWRNKQQNETIDVDNKIESLLRRTTDQARTEFIQRTMFTQNLIHEVEQKSNGWCRSEEDSCNDGEFCQAAQCVSARGGNEVCTNGNDDDNDGLWDCNDPDCPSCEEMNKEREDREENERQEIKEQQEENRKLPPEELPGEELPIVPPEEEQQDSTEEQTNEQPVGEQENEDTAPENPQEEQQREEDNEEQQEADSSSEESEQSNDQSEAPPSDSGTGSGINLFNNIQETSPYRVLAEVMGKLIGRLAIGSATDIFEETSSDQTEEQTAAPTREEPQESTEEQEQQREENSGENQQTDLPPEGDNKNRNNEDITQEDNNQAEERRADDSERENDERREEEEERNNEEQRDVCQSECTECSTCDWQSDSERCEQVCKPCNLCRYQQGQYNCHANEEFSQDRGFCMCLEGFSNCDGDWLNGCETQGQCQPCTQDEDCASARCSEDNRRVATFRCEQGDSWEEVKRHLDISGQCDVLSDGKTESGFWINGWGEGLNNFNLLKQQYYNQGNNEWCKQELEQALKERTMIEEGFTPAFMDWYFTEIVAQSPGEFEQQVRMIHGLQDLLARNTDHIGRALSCLGKESVDTSWKPIRIIYDSPYGNIELWEEEKTTTAFGKPVKVLHPYLKMWIFPPKEFIITKIKEEFSGIQGPRPDEIAEIQQEEMVMEEIEKISNRFDNGAELLVQLKERDTVLLEGLIRVNPEVIMQVEKVESYTGERDATVTVDADYLYETMEIVLKEIEGEHVQGPWWEEQQRQLFNDAFVGIKILGKAVVALTNGDINVEPDGQMGKIVLSLKEIIMLMTKVN